MGWRKLGQVYLPSGRLPWARSHAHLPTAEVLNDDVVRVYFAALDERQFGRIGYVDLDARDPLHILSEAQEPILDMGPLGAFDDSGVTPSCIVNCGAQKFLYYIGWQRCQRVPYMLYTGLAISEDGGASFRRSSAVPLLDRTNQDPFSRAAPMVLPWKDGFRMWYWTCTHWSTEGNHVHYHNVIKDAFSKDGLTWTSPDIVRVCPDAPLDYAVGRPWVVARGKSYQMWFSIRSSNPKMPYRIGFARSTNCEDWERLDHLAGIQCSSTGWDSEMVCYPCIIQVSGKLYMFYNGNGHGMTGFGCAVLEEHEHPY